MRRRSSVCSSRVVALALCALAAEAHSSAELPVRVVVKFRLANPSASEGAQELLARERKRPSDAVVADLSSRTAYPGRVPNYIPKPALRMVDNLQVGIVGGTAGASLTTQDCTPFVYVVCGAARKSEVREH